MCGNRRLGANTDFRVNQLFEAMDKQMMSKRNPECNATIYTQKLTAQLQLDPAKYNEQYPRVDIKTLKTAHDRFLILDRKEVYHIGTSLKDLGKKCQPAGAGFGFSKLNEFLPSFLEKLNAM